MSVLHGMLHRRCFMTEGFMIATIKATKLYKQASLLFTL